MGYCQSPGCGSQAINHHCHGRDGTRDDLCDVCFWRVQAERANTEIARLCALLSDAWVPRALEWSVKGVGEQTVANSVTDDFIFFVYCRKGQWRWDWDWMHGPAAAVECLAVSFTDAQRKAELWHRDRITAPFTKGEASS